MFSLRFNTQQLQLEHAFGISRWTRTHVQNVFIELEANGIIGIGESSPNARYNESAESNSVWLSRLDFSTMTNRYDISQLIRVLNEAGSGEYAAKVAVEMAFWDWVGKSLNVPLHKLWNAPSVIGPVSSFTIGIDTEEIIRQKVEEASPYPILKVKLGTDHDEDIIRIIRELTSKTLWVDANEGWTSFDKAVARVKFLQDKKIGMIEQPMPASMANEIGKLKAFTSIPLMADEGFTGSESLDELAENYSGINIKLMKIGSMHKAMQTIANARKKGLKIMIGCMIETALANTAAGILSLWADYADIDGFLLLKDRPYTGFSLDEMNRIVLTDLPGLGVIKK